MHQARTVATPPASPPTEAGWGRRDRAPDADPAEDTSELILRELPFLRRLAGSLVRQASDADDLVQETVFRAYRARERFRPGSSMRSWLSTILIRASLTSSRTRSRRGTCSWTDADLARDVAAPREVGDLHAASGFSAVEELLDDRLRSALLALEERFREPLCLFVLEGLPYTEIAQRLGVPVGTVMSRIFRARRRLRRDLAAVHPLRTPLHPIAV